MLTRVNPWATRHGRAVQTIGGGQVGGGAVQVDSRFAPGQDGEWGAGANRERIGIDR